MKFSARRLGVLALVCATCLALGACRVLVREARRDDAIKKQEEAQVIAALARYRQLVVEVDAGRLADLFVADGELSHGDEQPHAGRDAILAFLKTFAGFKVLEYDLRATTTTIEGERATQVGTYRQTAVTPGGTTIEAAGDFNAEWLHQSDGRWLLRRMHTRSPAGAPAG